MFAPHLTQKKVGGTRSNPETFSGESDVVPRGIPPDQILSATLRHKVENGSIVCYTSIFSISATQ